MEIRCIPDILSVAYIKLLIVFYMVDFPSVETMVNVRTETLPHPFMFDALVSFVSLNIGFSSCLLIFTWGLCACLLFRLLYIVIIYCTETFNSKVFLV